MANENVQRGRRQICTFRIGRLTSSATKNTIHIQVALQVYFSDNKKVKLEHLLLA